MAFFTNVKSTPHLDLLFIYNKIFSFPLLYETKNMTSEMYEVFHQYLDSYAQRNLESLNQILSQKLSGFGTGEDENTFEIDFRDLYQRDFDQIPNGLTFTIHKEDYHELSSVCFIAFAIFDLSAEINGIPHTLFSNRISCVFHKSIDDNNI